MRARLERLERAPHRARLVVAVFGCVVATAAASAAPAATFAARETHRGLVIDGAGTPAGMLVPNGGLFRRPSDPTFVYRDGAGVTAGVWESGSAAVVRSGTTENAPVVGRVIPTWKDDELALSIEPEGAKAIRTTVFKRTSGGGAPVLDRGTSTRVALEGSYRATVTASDGTPVGWLSVDIDPEGATRFAGDLPSAIPSPLAAAAAAAIEGEVDFIYASVIDVAPLRR